MKDNSSKEFFTRIQKFFSPKNKAEKQLSDSVIDQKTDVKPTTGIYKYENENDEFYCVNGINSKSSGS